MTDEPTRDEAVARALEGVAVPEYGAGFWDRLDARLSAEPFPGLDVGSLDAEPEGEPAPVPLLTPVPAPTPDPVLVDLATAAPAIRRRSLSLVGAAAAVALAVLGLQLADRGTSDLRETAAGAPEVTRQAPRGGSTTADDRPDDSAPEDSGGETPGSTARGATSGAPDAPGGGAARPGPAAGSAGGGAGAAGGAGTAMAPPGAVDSPQDAFVTWAAAIDSGDTEAAAALTGPRTHRYYEGLGTTAEAAAAEWGEAYGVWADSDGRRIDVLEATPSGGDKVVVVLVEGPAADPADGRTRAAVPVVEGPDGWLVEPAAFGPGDGPSAMASPPPSQPERASVRKDHVFEVPAAARGTFTFVLDRTTRGAVPAADAVEGTIRWDPPDKAMTPGRHVLVVTHVTDDTIVTSTLEVDVVG